MDYADTSALLKLVLPEPESPRIGNYLTSKGRILVSSLVILEMRTQVRGFFLSGKITRQQYRRIEKYIPVLVRSEPLEYQELSGAVFRMANEQIEAAPEVHCRSFLSGALDVRFRRRGYDRHWLCVHEPFLGQGVHRKYPDSGYSVKTRLISSKRVRFDRSNGFVEGVESFID